MARYQTKSKQVPKEYQIPTRYNIPTWEVDNDDVKAVVAKYNSTQDISDAESNVVISFIRERMKEEALKIKKEQYPFGFARGNSMTFQMEAEIGLVNGGYMQKSYEHIGIDLKALNGFHKRVGIARCNDLIGDIKRLNGLGICFQYEMQLKKRVRYYGITFEDLDPSSLRRDKIDSLEKYLSE